MPQPDVNTGLIPASQHCLARALYDNIAESPDELAFRKGEILIVLEQNTANIEGWWLCSLRGRQGICPGNRLRLIAGVFEDSGQGFDSSSHLQEIHHDFNTLQKQGKRRSWHVQPNQVVTPKKFNDVYLYDLPPTRCSPVPISGVSPRDPVTDCYDVPPRAIPYDPSRNCSRCSPAPLCMSPGSRDSGEAYDIPRSHLTHQNQLTPSSSASSLNADSLSSSNRSSVVNMLDYDIPKPYHRGPQLLLQPSQHYDVPTSHSLKELPLELNSALENLERLETDTTGAISKLLGYVCPQWRTREKLESNIMEIKLAVVRLRTSLHDLSEFVEGTLGNASRASDKNLATKLAPLVVALKNSDKLIQEATDKLQQQNWSVDLLCRRNDDEEKSYKPDSLEQLIACSKALTEDIRQTASFIQGNSTLLFKRELSPQRNNNEWGEDYDYVNLDSKDTVNKKHVEIRESLPKELKKGYDMLIKHADDVAVDGDNKNIGLDSDDRQVLAFFAAQSITHHNNLTQAIDAFLQTVEHNQPPKVFLAHGKFVVLSAHKLVHIGDTVHRNVTQTDIKTQALNCANALSEALAISVNKTKQAALKFPSVTAVQEMVDSIVDISHLARDLKVCLVQSTQTT